MKIFRRPSQPRRKFSPILQGNVLGNFGTVRHSTAKKGERMTISRRVWMWVLIGSVIFVVVTGIVVLLVLGGMRYHDNTNNNATSGCCADSYTDINGEEVTVCGYQPFRDNPDSSGNSSVSSTLTAGQSFAEACHAAGGEPSLASKKGVACYCTCNNPTSDMRPHVMASGEYVSSRAQSATITKTTTCPGYRE